MSSIDDIIETCEKSFGLKVNDKNRRTYTDFLERQLESHPEYDLNYLFKSKGRGKTKFPWVNLLADKLLLLSYVIGETAITVDSEGYQKRIGRDKAEEDRAEDLPLLSLRSMGIQTMHKENKTDKVLYTLYSRMRDRRNKFFIRKRWQSWSTLINEIGQDSIVQKYFGREISYDDVRQNKHNGVPSVNVKYALS